MHPRDQTIFALSSGRPPSAIALVRVSGPQAGKIVATLAGKTPSPRMATALRAVEQRASDIHIEPFENEIKVRYRIDGVLHEASSPPKSL